MEAVKSQSNIHKHLHEKALHIAGRYLHYEAELIGVFQELDRMKTHLHFKQPSLFAYATKQLNLCEHAALTLITIARKSVQVPDLKAAIAQKRINVSNARRITPILTPANKTEWLEKAATLSQTKLDLEIAKAFPQRGAPTKIRYKNEKLARLEIDVPMKVLELLKRTQELLSQKSKKHIDAAAALEIALAGFIEKNDPIHQAKRAETRAYARAKTIANDQATERALVLKQAKPYRLKKREPLPAQLKHAVALRDGTQCTHRNSDGKRCEERKWLDVHHIRPVSEGGTNDFENLQTLCNAHHRMEHIDAAA